jgi:hypothetical protein
MAFWQTARAGRGVAARRRLNVASDGALALLPPRCADSGQFDVPPPKQHRGAGQTRKRIGAWSKRRTRSAARVGRFGSRSASDSTVCNSAGAISLRWASPGSHCQTFGKLDASDSARPSGNHRARACRPVGLSRGVRSGGSREPCPADRAGSRPGRGARPLPKHPRPPDRRRPPPDLPLDLPRTQPPRRHAPEPDRYRHLQPLAPPPPRWPSPRPYPPARQVPRGPQRRPIHPNLPPDTPLEPGGGPRTPGRPQPASPRPRLRSATPARWQETAAESAIAATRNAAGAAISAAHKSPESRSAQVATWLKWPFKKLPGTSCRAAGPRASAGAALPAPAPKPAPSLDHAPRWR